MTEKEKQQYEDLSTRLRVELLKPHSFTRMCIAFGRNQTADSQTYRALLLTSAAAADVVFLPTKVALLVLPNKIAKKLLVDLSLTIMALKKRANQKRDNAASLTLPDVVKPPEAAKTLLMMVPKKHRQHLVGDLEEEFNTIIVPSKSLAGARRWYWWQVLYTIADLIIPMLWGLTKKVLGIFALSKLFSKFIG